MESRRATATAVRSLQQQLCNLRNTHVHTQRSLSPNNLFLGIGSIEAIDALIRCFCTPGKDRILTCPPTYGMYAVSAQVNDVGVLEVPLLPAPTFALDVPAITHVLSTDATIKLAYLASPGNPTGSLLSKTDVEDAAGLVTEYPNLVVMQTLSKAFGMAGIRLGAAFAPPPIASLLNSIKAPWNIPSPSSALASYAVSAEGQSVMRQNRAKIKAQMDRLLDELPAIPGVGRVRSGTDSNFLLFEIVDSQGQPGNAVAAAVYDRLAETRGVVLRFRGKEAGCFGCLRITVGTEDEITRFLDALRGTLAEMRKDGRKAVENGEWIDSGVDVSYSSSSSSIDRAMATEDDKDEEVNGVVVY